MTAIDPQRLLALRLVVGFLGEREQAGWWPSDFLGRNSVAFLSPVFGSKSQMARYHGAIEAACAVHDERIGLGKVNHLFRVPEPIEHSMYEMIQQDNSLSQIGPNFTSKANACAWLSEIGNKGVEVRSGPVRISMFDTNRAESTDIAILASYYRFAFLSGVQCFPYFNQNK